MSYTDRLKAIKTSTSPRGSITSHDDMEGVGLSLGLTIASLSFKKQQPCRWRIASSMFICVSFLATMLSACRDDPTQMEFHIALRNLAGVKTANYDMSSDEAVSCVRNALEESKAVDSPALRATNRAGLTLAFKNSAEPVAVDLLYEDIVDNPGYIRWRGVWYEVPADLTFVLTDANSKAASWDINDSDAGFLSRYGCAPVFLLGSLKITLPADLKHAPGQFPDALYWAHIRELSADVDLDISSAFGHEVDVAIYRVIGVPSEILSDGRANVRAIVVRDQGKIVGAWLDRFPASWLGWSLLGNTLEDISGQALETWLEGFADAESALEKSLSQLTPEEIIHGFFRALDSDDKDSAHIYESRFVLTGYLLTGGREDKLIGSDFMNDGNSWFSAIKSVQVISIKPFRSLDDAENEVSYSVVVDMSLDPAWASPSGRQGFIVTLAQEPSSGWKIRGIGTGP